MEICDSEICTGCGTCIDVCPRRAVTFRTDILNGYKATINLDSCIECGLCRKVCPGLNAPQKNASTICYAACSTDETIRKNSASGGIATSIYKYCENHNAWYVGCSMDSDNMAVLELIKDNFEAFQNSKYVYSDARNIYLNVANKLKDNVSVVFVGLPCQVAGIKKFLEIKNISQEQLLCVDIICHGVISNDLFKAYLSKYEKKHNTNVERVFFRNPKFSTDKFILTLENKNGIFYKAAVKRRDEYQLAYHRGIAYRDNCYKCQYACKERVGDLTIGDFTRVGSLDSVSYDTKKLSCILINTVNGDTFIKTLHKDGYLFLDKRPLEEEYNSEKQLRAPTLVSKERKDYLKYMHKYNFDFCKAIQKACKIRIIKNEIKAILKRT